MRCATPSRRCDGGEDVVERDQLAQSVQVDRRPAAALTAAVPRAAGRRTPRRTSSTSPSSSAGDDQALRRAVQVPRHLEQQRADEVGEHGRRGRAALAAQSQRRDLERDAVGAGALERRLHRLRLDVAREHRRPAELRRRDRQHAAAAAPVGERARGRELGQQLERQPGGGVRAGPERLARGRSRRPARRRAAGSHGGRTRSGADVDRQRGSERQCSSQSSGPRSWRRPPVAPPAARTSPTSGSSPARAVEHELDVVAGLALLEPAGRERQQLGEHELGVLAPRTRTASRITSSTSGGPAVELAPARRSRMPERESSSPARKPGGDQQLRALLPRPISASSSGRVQVGDAPIGAYGARLVRRVADSASTPFARSVSTAAGSSSTAVTGA